MELKSFVSEKTIQKEKDKKQEEWEAKRTEEDPLGKAQRARQGTHDKVMCVGAAAHAQTAGMCAKAWLRCSPRSCCDTVPCGLLTAAPSPSPSLRARARGPGARCLPAARLAERPEEVYDGRSLYERLKSQEDKKQEEFEEAHKLSPCAVAPVFGAPPYNHPTGAHGRASRRPGGGSHVHGAPWAPSGKGLPQGCSSGGCLLPAACCLLRLCARVHRSGGWFSTACGRVVRWLGAALTAP